MSVVRRDIELETILAHCESSLKAHCQVFHPHRFTAPFSSRHEELFKVLDSRDRPQHILLKAHRGFGKTSLINYALPSQSIVFSKEQFVVPISATSTLAEMQSENLKTELRTNNRVRAVIGEIETPDNPFSKTIWRTGNGVWVFPRGAGQQIRGILLGNDRPGLICIDDLEKKDEVRNPDIRKQLKEWFFEDVMGCVDRRKNQYRIVMIGTVLHEDSLLQNLADDPNWLVLDFALANEELQTYWPEYMSTADVKRLYDHYKGMGMLSSFYREYMNDPSPAEDAAFKQEMFRYYNEGELDLNREGDNFIIVDPAKTLKQHSDPTAIVGICWQDSAKRIYVRDIVNRRMYPDQIYQEAFDMADRLNAKVVGVEVTSLNEFILQPLRNAMLLRGRPYEIVELKPRRGQGTEVTGERDKARIGSLAAYYRMGLVYHNPACCAPLEQQLLSFPNSKHDDVADAFSYTIEMAHLGDRYFEGIDLSLPDATEEDMYKQLEKEDIPALDEEEYCCVRW